VATTNQITEDQFDKNRKKIEAGRRKPHMVSEGIWKVGGGFPWNFKGEKLSPSVIADLFPHSRFKQCKGAEVDQELVEA
jgi:hypothetical protein